MLGTGRQVPKLVGQTPYVLKGSGFGGSQEPSLVVVSKEGFQKTSVVIPSTVFDHAGTVSIQLKEESKQRNVDNLDLALEQVAKGVAQVQSLIQRKELDQGLSTVNTLLSSYPNISTLYDLQGNIYYLRKDIDRALASYKRANAITPNSETNRMISKLQELRTPANNNSNSGGRN
jgi:tetratricopeptide (TPR) repeat protein